MFIAEFEVIFVKFNLKSVWIYVCFWCSTCFQQIVAESICWKAFLKIPSGGKLWSKVNRQRLSNRCFKLMVYLLFIRTNLIKTLRLKLVKKSKNKWRTFWDWEFQKQSIKITIIYICFKSEVTNEYPEHRQSHILSCQSCYWMFHPSLWTLYSSRVLLKCYIIQF